MSLFGAGEFVVGANLPWVGYGTDVGASVWHPMGGLSGRPQALERLDATFARLEQDGVSLVRQFLLCDARSGVRFDTDGVPAGLDESVFPDMDALLASARRHSIQLLPVLLDFHLCHAAKVFNGVQLGGRSQVVVDPGARHALIDRVLRPIIERYGDEDGIVAWDVMNEPEWCLQKRPRTRRVTFQALQDFLGACVQCVHACARQPVTIGCAGTARLDLVTPLGLDFYQIHWYEKFGWPALAQPVAELGLGDRPVILGEFPGRSESAGDMIDAARGAGYQAALVWSVLGEDNQSAYPPGVVVPRPPLLT